MIDVNAEFAASAAEVGYAPLIGLSAIGVAGVVGSNVAIGCGRRLGEKLADAACEHPLLTAALVVGGLAVAGYAVYSGVKKLEEKEVVPTSK